MKNPHAFLAALSLTVLLLFYGCTHTDNSLSPISGTWHLEEMIINGDLDQTYESNRQEGRLQVIVTFQGKIFHMSYNGGTSMYGSWEYSGEVLTLIAGKNEGNYTTYFDPFPTVMHLPSGVTMAEVTVTRLQGTDMQWQAIDQNGQLITYNFRKY